MGLAQCQPRSYGERPQVRRGNKNKADTKQEGDRRELTLAPLWREPCSFALMTCTGATWQLADPTAANYPESGRSSRATGAGRSSCAPRRSAFASNASPSK
jgi:hypothetical protein